MIHKGRCFGVVDDVTGRYKKSKGLVSCSIHVFSTKKNRIPSIIKKLCVAVVGVLLLAFHLTSQVSLIRASFFCFVSKYFHQPFRLRWESTVANGICLRMKRCNGADELNVQLGIEVKTLCLECIYDLVILGEKS